MPIASVRSAPASSITDTPGTGGYLALQIVLRPTSPLVRYVYLKAHTGDDALPSERTLFVCGLPVDLD